MKKSTIALIAGASALAAASAFASGHGKKEGDYDWEAKVEEHFNAVDANNDGQVSGEEYLAYKRAKAEESWEKMADAMGDDGMLSLEEAKAHHKAKKEKMKAKMKEKMDKGEE